MGRLRGPNPHQLVEIELMDFEVLVIMSLGDQEIQEWVHISKGEWTHFVVFT